jgi:sodium transport system ATP-binding protein
MVGRDMIEVNTLQKRYGEITAVDGVTFKCPDACITGLLGPNGAGKSTTLRMIAGLIRPDSGTVFIDGTDMIRDRRKALRRLGVQSDTGGIYPRLTAREQLRYYGQLHGLSSDNLEQHVQNVITLLNMTDIADRRAEGFSRGQRQKIVIGRSLVHDPANMILDEPTNGLDVMAVRETRDTIRAFRQQGRCVLFSTHSMDEAERLCDQIIIIDHGVILASGSPAELIQKTGTSSLEDAFVSLTGQQNITEGETLKEVKA